MTLNYATSLNDQVDYLSPNGRSFAEQTLNSIFNVSPRNAVIDDDDDDLDDDDAVPDTDDDLYEDDDDDVFPDSDDLGDADDDDLDEEEDDDDDTGSTTAGLNNPPVSGRGAQGRTTGRMIDHEPGFINNNDI